MNIAFPTVDEDYLKQKVDQGFYGNITEAVRDAVRRMRELDEKRKLDELRILLATGLDQIEQGEVIPYKTNLLDNALEKARQNAQQGKAIKDAVKPV
jgi:antitoxin ParD1/3/4